jgi:Zn-dependent metalloprotease
MHKRSTRTALSRLGGATTAVLLAAGALGALAPGAAAGPTSITRAHSSKVVAGAVTALRQHSTELRLTKGQSFRATDTVLDRSGASHVRMTRTYRGLPVLGGDLVVHRAADGSWAGVSRTLTAPLRMSTSPRLSVAAAQERAIRPTKATRGISHVKAKGAPRLVVDTIGHRARLAWAVTTGGRRADGTPSRMTSYVDARTGAVLRREEGIETVDGSGQSLYSGTVPLKLTQSGSTYSL